MVVHHWCFGVFLANGTGPLVKTKYEDIHIKSMLHCMYYLRHIFIFCTISWRVPIIPGLTSHRLCNDMLYSHVSIRDRNIVVFFLFRGCLTLHVQPVEQWTGIHCVQHGSWFNTATGHLNRSRDSNYTAWTAFFKLLYSRTEILKNI